MHWVGWLCALPGVWLICAPFLLGYSGTSGALWNDILIGICVACLGIRTAMVFRKRCFLVISF